MNPTTPNGADIDDVNALYPNGSFKHLPDASRDELASLSLRGVSDALRAAQWPAWVAAFSLKGARQERAKELIKLMDAAREHCERLLVVVDGDARANNPDRSS